MVSVHRRVDVQSEPEAAAQAVGLRYVRDDGPGIRRKRAGKGFFYRTPDGKAVLGEHREWIEKLAIPPAWTDVWICPHKDGHIQATGRDVKGRKQYRYHPKFREFRDQTKYHRLITFGETLPAMRRRAARDLARRGLPRVKVLALIFSLLDRTLIRIGNAEYARDNNSFGLTTLRDHHVEIRGKKARFSFRGKSGKDHEIEVDDPRLAKLIKRCRDLPGEDLFQYIDDEGNVQRVCSNDVNDYLRKISGADFTAKDFRTWGGTVRAHEFLRAAGVGRSEKHCKKTICSAIKAVASSLGNTQATCRKYYVHPEVLRSYQDGSLFELKPSPVLNGMAAEEARLMALLRSCARRERAA